VKQSSNSDRLRRLERSVCDFQAKQVKAPFGKSAKKLKGVGICGEQRDHEQLTRGLRDVYALQR